MYIHTEAHQVGQPLVNSAQPATTQADSHTQSTVETRKVELVRLVSWYLLHTAGFQQQQSSKCIYSPVQCCEHSQYTPNYLMFDIQQILKSWGYQCIYVTTMSVATKAGKRSMNLSRAIKSNDIGGMLTSMKEWISRSILLLFIVLYLFRFMSTLHCAIYQLKFEEDVRNITAVMTKPLVSWYSTTWGQWALTTSALRWVSAPPLYDSVRAQQWSQQCSQNLCLPFMSSQPLHYLTGSNVFPY